MRTHGWVGLGIIAMAEALLLAREPTVAGWFTPIVWTGYVLFVDALAARLTGRSDGVGVERTFPLYSPNIDSIEVNKTGRVRRAKLYFQRKRSGKSARIKEKRQAVEALAE